MNQIRLAPARTAAARAGALIVVALVFVVAERREHHTRYASWPRSSDSLKAEQPLGPLATCPSVKHIV